MSKTKNLVAPLEIVRLYEEFKYLVKKRNYIKASEILIDMREFQGGEKLANELKTELDTEIHNIQELENNSEKKAEKILSAINAFETFLADNYIELAEDELEFIKEHAEEKLYLQLVKKLEGHKVPEKHIYESENKNNFLDILKLIEKGHAKKAKDAINTSNLSDADIKSLNNALKNYQQKQAKEASKLKEKFYKLILDGQFLEAEKLTKKKVFSKEQKNKLLADLNNKKRIDLQAKFNTLVREEKCQEAEKISKLNIFSKDEKSSMTAQIEKLKSKKENAATLQKKEKIKVKFNKHIQSREFSAAKKIAENTVFSPKEKQDLIAILEEKISDENKKSLEQLENQLKIAISAKNEKNAKQILKKIKNLADEDRYLISLKTFQLLSKETNSSDKLIECSDLLDKIEKRSELKISSSEINCLIKSHYLFTGIARKPVIKSVIEEEKIIEYEKLISENKFSLLINKIKKLKINTKCKKHFCLEAERFKETLQAIKNAEFERAEKMNQKSEISSLSANYLLQFSSQEEYKKLTDNIGGKIDSLEKAIQALEKNEDFDTVLTKRNEIAMLEQKLKIAENKLISSSERLKKELRDSKDNIAKNNTNISLLNLVYYLRVQNKQNEENDIKTINQGLKIVKDHLYNNQHNLARDEFVKIYYLLDFDSKIKIVSLVLKQEIKLLNKEKEVELVCTVNIFNDYLKQEKFQEALKFIEENKKILSESELSIQKDKLEEALDKKIWSYNLREERPEKLIKIMKKINSDKYEILTRNIQNFSNKSKKPFKQIAKEKLIADFKLYNSYFQRGLIFTELSELIKRITDPLISRYLAGKKEYIVFCPVFNPWANKIIRTINNEEKIANFAIEYFSFFNYAQLESILAKLSKIRYEKLISREEDLAKSTLDKIENLLYQFKYRESHLEITKLLGELSEYNYISCLSNIINALEKILNKEELLFKKQSQDFLYRKNLYEFFTKEQKQLIAMKKADIEIAKQNTMEQKIKILKLYEAEITKKKSMVLVKKHFIQSKNNQDLNLLINYELSSSIKHQDILDKLIFRVINENVILKKVPNLKFLDNLSLNGERNRMQQRRKSHLDEKKKKLWQFKDDYRKISNLIQSANFTEARKELEKIPYSLSFRDSDHLYLSLLEKELSFI